MRKWKIFATASVVFFVTFLGLCGAGYWFPAVFWSGLMCALVSAAHKKEGEW